MPKMFIEPNDLGTECGSRFVDNKFTAYKLESRFLIAPRLPRRSIRSQLSAHLFDTALRRVRNAAHGATDRLVPRSRMCLVNFAAADTTVCSWVTARLQNAILTDRNGPTFCCREVHRHIN